jgi:hypothetical protein
MKSLCVRFDVPVDKLGNRMDGIAKCDTFHWIYPDMLDGKISCSKTIFLDFNLAL